MILEIRLRLVLQDRFAYVSSKGCKCEARAALKEEDVLQTGGIVTELQEVLVVASAGEVRLYECAANVQAIAQQAKGIVHALCVGHSQGVIDAPAATLDLAAQPSESRWR